MSASQLTCAKRLARKQKTLRVERVMVRDG